MPRKINCILLVDDDPDDNFLHKLIIEESGLCDCVCIAENGLQALELLKNTESDCYLRPEVILLDINMPGMNGFEFLEEYEKLPPEQKARVVLMMLTTSLNPDDERRAREFGDVSGYRSKPLTRDMLDDVVKKYFP